ncbi:hypothetical protein GCM10009552_09740 [Rothia nasimurium]
MTHEGASGTRAFIFAIRRMPDHPTNAALLQERALRATAACDGPPVARKARSYRSRVTWPGNELVARKARSYRQPGQVVWKRVTRTI